MIEQLKSFIENLKTNPRIETFDEAATKQAIILPILHSLGWNTYNIDEVFPEFSVEGGRVDYSLRDNNANKVFLEVKKTGADLENHEQQLLLYSFRQGVKLASLTNGTTWWFYLPTEEGDWRTRKFYTIDITQQESHDVAQKFIDLLSKNSVQSGEAIRNAKAIYKGRQRKKVIEETLPEAWNKIIGEPESLLVDLISEATEKLCGFKPESKETVEFLKNYEGQFLLSPQDEIIEAPPPVTPRRNIAGGRRISQDELIPHMIRILQRYNGRARKNQVEDELYQMFRDIFNEPYYKELVSNGIPRWQHNIAWAKERAKKRGLIKGPDESGRGNWELTAKGRNMSS